MGFGSLRQPLKTNFFHLEQTKKNTFVKRKTFGMNSLIFMLKKRKTFDMFCNVIKATKKKKGFDNIYITV